MCQEIMSKKLPHGHFDPDDEIKNSGKKNGKSRIPNFCYIQVIVFDRSTFYIFTIFSW